jgi:hypothetical protein
MRPVAPRTGAPEQTIAEEQEEYLPATVAFYRFTDTPKAVGVLWRYTFSAEEREQIAAGEDVYIMHIQPNGPAPITPMSARVGPGPWATGEIVDG